MKNLFLTYFLFSLVLSIQAHSQSADTLILRDIAWDKTSPASQTELFIPSANVLMPGFIYKANGAGKHPTLILLHGFPGNERNLDLAQVVRARGWNAIYFDYRGSWGSQGNFSFTNCVEDVKNVVAFCKKYSDSLQIDTSNIVLFGHSMGGWVCLKALQQLPGIKKGFALSTWNIAGDFKSINTDQQLQDMVKSGDAVPEYFVLNTPTLKIFEPVIANKAFYDLSNDATALANKQIIMLDEHHGNAAVAAAIQQKNKVGFQYEVWQTDHPFTNKRVALMKKVLAFLNNK